MARRKMKQVIPTESVVLKNMARTTGTGGTPGKEQEGGEPQTEDYRKKP